MDKDLDIKLLNILIKYYLKKLLVLYDAPILNYLKIKKYIIILLKLYKQLGELEK